MTNKTYRINVNLVKESKNSKDKLLLEFSTNDNLKPVTNNNEMPADGLPRSKGPDGCTDEQLEYKNKLVARAMELIDPWFYPAKEEDRAKHPKLKLLVKKISSAKCDERMTAVKMAFMDLRDKVADLPKPEQLPIQTSKTKATKIRRRRGPRSLCGTSRKGKCFYNVNSKQIAIMRKYHTNSNDFLSTENPNKCSVKEIEQICELQSFLNKTWNNMNAVHKATGLGLKAPPKLKVDGKYGPRTICTHALALYVIETREGIENLPDGTIGKGDKKFGEADFNSLGCPADIQRLANQMGDPSVRSAKSSSSEPSSTENPPSVYSRKKKILIRLGFDSDKWTKPEIAKVEVYRKQNPDDTGIWISQGVSYPHLGTMSGAKVQHAGGVLDFNMLLGLEKEAIHNAAFSTRSNQGTDKMAKRLSRQFVPKLVRNLNRSDIMSQLRGLWSTGVPIEEIEVKIVTYILGADEDEKEKLSKKRVWKKRLAFAPAGTYVFKTDPSGVSPGFALSSTKEPE